MEYRLISAQSYVVPPQDLWQKRLPSQHTAAGPRPRTSGDGWVVGAGETATEVPLAAFAAFGGLTSNGVNAAGTLKFDALPAGASDPRARLEAQDEDSVDAEVLYPYRQVMNAIAKIADRDLQLACTKVYNDWIAEFCATAPDRLIGLGQIPSTGAGDAVAELEENVNARKLRGVQLRNFPAGTAAPSENDEPFWQRLMELGTGVTVDTVFGDGLTGVPPLIDGAFEQTPSISRSLGAMLYAKTLDKFPDLRLVIAGVDAGWVPSWFEGTDNNFMRTVGMRGYQLGNPDEMPSDYFRRHFLYTVRSTDTVAVRFRQYVGVGHIMWASDYPTGDSYWPDNRGRAERLVRELPEEISRAILAGNVARIYRLPGWEGLQASNPEPVKLPHMLTVPV